MPFKITLVIAEKSDRVTVEHQGIGSEPTDKEKQYARCVRHLLNFGLPKIAAELGCEKAILWEKDGTPAPEHRL